jgi:hypothetical protein
METKIENGFLILKLPLQPPTPSSTGKTLIVASTGGNIVTAATIDDKPVIVGVNAYIRADRAAVKAVDAAGVAS